jgi:hypothetical protein
LEAPTGGGNEYVICSRFGIIKIRRAAKQSTPRFPSTTLITQIFKSTKETIKLEQLSDKVSKDYVLKNTGLANGLIEFIITHLLLF